MGVLDFIFEKDEEKESLLKRKKEIQDFLQKNIELIPILTGMPPNYWNYSVIGLMSSQITTGMGPWTDLSQEFNNLFGGTSRSTNAAIAKAMETCKADVRLQCVRKGGNAIISTDLDFSEVGSKGNMMLICLSGTAINIQNLEDSYLKDKNVLDKISRGVEELEEINIKLSEI